MKTKFSGILTLLLVLVVQLAFAQEKTISGTVTDDTGLPLPGVNIIIKGTSTGTQSDFDGNYTIEAAVGQTLVYSYVGFETQEIAVGASNRIDVTMQAGSVLDEVVVTALGVSREKQSLGYSTQQVEGEDISTVKGNNFTNALSGKVSGLNIKRNNNFGGSTNVVIRGNTSLTGDNQALFVVDGVPISNRNTNTAGQTQASGNYYDYGNAAADVNPDDIESINVLKGAAASALYGSRAANGVIIITTKKGKKSKGLGVTINSNAQVGFIDKSTFAVYQKDYGAGYGAYYDGPDGFWYEEDINGDGSDDLVVPYTEDASYGAPFDGRLVYQWDSFDPESPNYLKATPWRSAANGPITFFETPITLTNSISISNGLEKGSYRMSYTKLDQSGLMPNSQLDRHNFILSGTYDVSDKLTASGFANYIKTDALGRNSTGYNDNVVGNFKQWWQTNVDIQQQRDIYFATRRNVTWNPVSSAPGAQPIFWDNPYWTRYENYQNDGRSRFIGNFELNYELAEWVNVTGRVSTDTYNEQQEERRAVGSVPTNFGVTRGNVDSGYLRRDITATETNYDLMFNFDADFSESISFAGILGTNIRRNDFNSLTSSTAGGLIVEGLYSLQNTKSPNPRPVEQAEKIGVDGVYASASFGFGNVVYLDGTIRRDHFSTLPEDNSSFYYPSVSTSFVFSKLMNVNAISFGKLRLNYAEVGNGAPFDRLFDTFVINNDIGTSVPSVRNNPELKPETTKSYEAGLEMRFANNRLGFDVAYYKSNSIDQIVQVPITAASGYTGKLLNAGEIENKGIEVSLNAMPVKNDNFTWGLNINWSQNKSEVLELPEGIETLQLGAFQGGVTINAVKGQPYGVIYGTDYTYLNGQRVVDPANGQYIATAASNNVIGDTNPDWLAGISNTLTYKDLSFSFLIDIQEGGSIFSLDQYYGLATGLYENTSFINDLGNPVRNTLADGGGFINEGVNPDGSVNTTRIRADRYGAQGYARGLPNSAFVYDASYIKLRQVSLTYTLPSRFLDNTFMTGLQFSVSGSNLWIIDKNMPYADPESGLSSGNLQGYSTGALPTTQDYGFNIKAQF
ncbi:SusC/RagA family TonB-linked outer membrane protein [Aequorivita vladivostokensis]|uniref:Membrane protein n=1 Tax=Aequorivita vladivostokensis TaxID=171194 RepID=A0ABR5DI37_9FLAO|nr:SusC/RagA family TonB-linked outer membrane protein [Aequorivita vladivostokensis]KJJ38396.1 membrane protein [Aequorivita vladivostokensis]MAB57279.1 SusC/RagA family TonB-linked outer membrane protein [Aequorivita sp.]MBF29621.1 SusC/RagA family TonB-linked outer membrane protein [Aequorivita sp.]|tara:strand:- start:194661 stop:197891 length:3231 start_codon:yes stop_codon:yes gene_type:complete